MKMKIPITGTVKDINAKRGEISGDPKDPIRPVKIDLGGISWKMVSIDLANDLMEIEVTPPEKVDVPVLDGDNNPVMEDGKPKMVSRLTTAAEKMTALNNARHIIESRTTTELYALTGEKRLVKPAAVMKKLKGGK